MEDQIIPMIISNLGASYTPNVRDIMTVIATPPYENHFVLHYAEAFVAGVKGSVKE